MKQKMRQIIGFIIGMVLTIGLDQWTKYLTVTKLKGQDPFVIWKGVFELQYLENRGAAFGMLQGQQLFFFLVAVIVLIAAAYLLWRMPTSRYYLPLLICLCLIVSGAVGNMIDRISLGYVVDMLYFKLIDFPIFNVADCYVTVATVFVIMFIIFRYKEKDLEVFNWNYGRKTSFSNKEEAD